MKPRIIRLTLLFCLLLLMFSFQVQAQDNTTTLRLPENPTLALALAVIVGESLLIVALLALVLRYVSKEQTTMALVANLVPVDAVRSITDEGIKWVQTYTERTATHADDWAAPFLKRAVDAGLLALEKRQKTAEEIVLEVPEGGVG